MNDFILSDYQYANLKSEYDKQITTDPTAPISLLNSIIKSLENNGFLMPINLQKIILSNLLQAQQLLQILNSTNKHSSIQLKNNPFSLIYHLSILSNQLTSHPFKSAYQLIYLKANNLIIKSISQVCGYFIKKCN